MAYIGNESTSELVEHVAYIKYLKILCMLVQLNSDGKVEYGLDPKRIVACGVSTGRYYAFRIAHTHATRLLASVGPGGWSHFMLDPNWIRAMNYMEYTFALADALAYNLLGVRSVSTNVKLGRGMKPGSKHLSIISPRSKR